MTEPGHCVSTSIQLALAVVITLLSGAQAQIEHRVNPFASSRLWGYEKEPTRGARARRDG